VGLGVLSLFVSRLSADDVFYVNRATAVAELNRIPVKDVLITNEQVAPASGVGLPVDSFSALQGAVGRLLDLHAASVAYYLAPVLFTFLATWALWRLVRSWAPRWAPACFVIAVAFLLLSAQDYLTPGSFFLERMWQGKVIFVAWLVPTLYAYFTRWLYARRWDTAVLLLAAGVAAIGLTGSASFAAPLVFATLALPLLARRDWRGLPILIAAAAVPFLVGLFATRLYPLADALGGGEKSERYYFHSLFGSGLVATIGALALVSAPWLARRGTPRALASAIATVTLVLVAPGLLAMLQDVTGLTGSLRRTLWLVPLPALVGLLASIPVPARPRLRAARALPAVLLLVLLALYGNPLWDSLTGRVSHLTSSPAWKTKQEPLVAARRILARYGGERAILADSRIMAAIAISTVAPKAVNPRYWYVSLTGESERRKALRLELTRLVQGQKPAATGEWVRSALHELDVGLICVDENRERVLELIRNAASYEPAFRTSDRLCLEAPTSTGR